MLTASFANLTASQVAALPLAEKLEYQRQLKAQRAAEDAALFGSIDKRFTVWESKDKTVDGKFKAGTGNRYLQFKANAGGKAILLTRAQVTELIENAQAVLNALNELNIT